MNPGLRQQWERFRASEPGHRFRERYENRSRARNQGGNVLHIAKIVLGVLVVPLGLVMVPAPGPGWVVVFLGLALLSDEILPMARGLDKAEILIRKTAARFRRRHLRGRRHRTV